MRDKAKKIVETILSGVEAYGRMEGRRGNRHIIFEGVFNKNTGKEEKGIQERMIDFVEKELRQVPNERAN